MIVLRGGARGTRGPARPAQPRGPLHGRSLGLPRRLGRPPAKGRATPRCAPRPIREVREEAGIELPDPGALLAFSRWITPAEVKTRFDTWFFLAPLPPGATPRVDGGEVVDARWYAPAAALEERRRGELMLVFPTIKHLEQLLAFDSVDALLTHARGREVRPVQPRVLGSGEQARIVLPGEPGYRD